MGIIRTSVPWVGLHVRLLLAVCLASPPTWPAPSFPSSLAAVRVVDESRLLHALWITCLHFSLVQAKLA